MRFRIARFLPGLPLLLASADVAADAPLVAPLVFNTFVLLVWAVLVVWMCAGFTVLEAGSVHRRNQANICLKNAGLFAVAGVAYYVVGYNLMYLDVGRYMGTFSVPYRHPAGEAALLAGTPASIEGDGVRAADWFFQMAFVATTASIVSGTLAERIKVGPFLLFSAVLAALVYPLVGAWTWGGGWLHALGFRDFAGAAVVHCTGGAAALAGTLVIGPRRGKFRAGRVMPTPPSSVPFITLGLFILWMGWFGFNGGSLLRFHTEAAAVSLAAVLMNTTLAGSAGILSALCLCRPVLGRPDVLAILNGALGGLVAITAAPDVATPWMALAVGALAGALVLGGIRLLERFRIDDVVGAIPVHLFCGGFGVLAAVFTSGRALGPQLFGLAVIVGCVFLATLTVWFVLEFVFGVRASTTAEEIGLDESELGLAPDGPPPPPAPRAPHRGAPVVRTGARGRRDG